MGSGPSDGHSSAPDLGPAESPRHAQPTSETQAYQAEERLRLLIDSIKDYAVFMLDPNGRVITWNTGARHIKGYTADEIVGQHISRFYTPEDRRDGRPLRLLGIAAAEGRVEDEGWRVRKDGTPFWADVVISALRDATGQLVGFAKVTRDLTERRRLELDRIRLAQAREAIHLRDEFLSIASHELKTPLTALQLHLQSLYERVEAAADDKLFRKVDRAIRATDRLAGLVETLLDASRIALGRFTLDLRPFDLSAAAWDVAEQLHAIAEQAGCPLRVVAPEPVLGTWDRLRLEQVITNLLANAFRYGANSPVELEVRADGNTALLEVRDEGPGVPVDRLEQIFQRFERASSTRHYGGLGLGLYVARQLAHAHRGALTAVNRAQGGALFCLSLPRDLEPGRVDWTPGADP